MSNLQFHWEPIAYLLSCGLHDMGYRHWLESVPDKQAFPYDPDWEAYERLEKDNVFRIIAVRFQGHLVGYAGVRIYQNMQSRGVTCSYIQEYYVEPKFRPKGAGLGLFRFIEQQLRLMKVKHVAVQVPIIVDEIEKVFSHLGYAPQGNILTKSLAET